MEFNRLINAFTASAIIIMLVTALVGGAFAVSSRAESNLGAVNNSEFGKITNLCPIYFNKT